MHVMIQFWPGVIDRGFDVAVCKIRWERIRYLGFRKNRFGWDGRWIVSWREKGDILVVNFAPDLNVVASLLMTVEVQIYRLEHEPGWTFEVVNEEGSLCRKEEPPRRAAKASSGKACRTPWGPIAMDAPRSNTAPADRRTHTKPMKVVAMIVPVARLAPRPLSAPPEA
jgi:hypothetical protein